MLMIVESDEPERLSIRGEKVFHEGRVSAHGIGLAGLFADTLNEKWRTRFSVLKRPPRGLEIAYPHDLLFVYHRHVRQALYLPI